MYWNPNSGKTSSLDSERQGRCYAAARRLYHAVGLYEMRYQHNRPDQCYCKVEMCEKVVPQVKRYLKREDAARVRSVTGFVADYQHDPRP